MEAPIAAAHRVLVEQYLREVSSRPHDDEKEAATLREMYDSIGALLRELERASPLTTTTPRAVPTTQVATTGLSALARKALPKAKVKVAPSEHRIRPPEKVQVNHRRLLHTRTRMLKEEASQARKENELLFAARCREIFNEIDTDSSGTLDVEELGIAAEMLGRKLNEKDFAKMLEFDVDQDNQLNIDEFVALMSTKEQERAEKTAEMLQKHAHRLADLGKLARVTTRVQESFLKAMNPSNVYVRIWDSVVLGILVVLLPLVPLVFAFTQLDAKLRDFELACDIFFALDILKNFNVGFIDQNDDLHMDHRDIAKNYLSFWFWPDLLSVASLVTPIKRQHATFSALDVLKTFKLVKLLRTAKLVEAISPVWYELQDYYRLHISDAWLKLMKLFGVFLIMAHMMGCLIYALPRIHGFPQDSWIVIAKLVDHDGEPLMSVAKQYRWCICRALGLIVMEAYDRPYTRSTCDDTSGWCEVETWLTLACLYMGSFFYAALISNIGCIVSDMNISRRAFEEKVSQADEYLASKRVPLAMRERVREFYHLRYAKGRIFNEPAILGSLNDELRTDILVHNSRALVKLVPLLSRAPERFARYVAVELQVSVFFARDLIIQEGSTGDDISFIKQGTCELLLRACGNVAAHVIAAGCYFGEVAALFGCKRTASIRTLAVTVTYSLPGFKFRDALTDFPEVDKYVRDVARSRKAWLDAIAAAFASDLPLPMKDDKEDKQTELYEQQSRFTSIIRDTLDDIDALDHRRRLSLRASRVDTVLAKNLTNDSSAPSGGSMGRRERNLAVVPRQQRASLLKAARVDGQL